MTTIETTYVREREGVLYVGETRVTLTSVIGAWLTEGYTPEELHLGFPALSLAQVYGAIAYYLEHSEVVTIQLDEEKARFRSQSEHDQLADPDFYRRLEERKFRLRGHGRSALRPYK